MNNLSNQTMFQLCTKLILYTTLIGVFFNNCVHAEFLKLGPFSYAADDAKSAIFVAQAEYPASGLLIAAFDSPISLQSLNPSKIPSQGVRSAYLVYNTSKFTFDKMIIGNGKEYQIVGSLTLDMGEVRVAISNNYSSPYLTIVNNKSKKPGILGFIGKNEVLNLKTENAIALLEANQLNSKELSELIKPYYLEQNGDIILNGEKLTTTQIGFRNFADNPCLTSGSLLINESDLTLFDSKQTATKENIFSNPILSKIKKLQIDEFLMPSITSEKIVAFNLSGQYGVIKLHSQQASNKLCVFSSVEIN